MRDWLRRKLMRWLGVDNLLNRVISVDADLVRLRALYDAATVTLSDIGGSRRGLNTTIVVASRFKQDHVRIYTMHFDDIRELDAFLASAGLDRSSRAYVDAPYDLRRPIRQPDRRKGIWI